MTYISDSTIEHRSFELLSKYSRDFNWEPAFPIPIEMIVEKQLKYSLDTFAVDKNILGAIDQVNKIIYTNENAMPYFKQYPGLFEFTIAHEVGHWDLHCHFNTNQLCIMDKTVSMICRANDKDFKEIQANKYAANILMPENLVRRTLKNVDFYNWPTLYKIAKDWHVSITALKNRLEKLQLLYYDKDTKTFYKDRNTAIGQQSLFQLNL